MGQTDDARAQFTKWSTVVRKTLCFSSSSSGRFGESFVIEMPMPVGSWLPTWGSSLPRSAIEALLALTRAHLGSVHRLDPGEVALREDVDEADHEETDEHGH